MWKVYDKLIEAISADMRKPQMRKRGLVGKVCGLDYSEISVAKTAKLNRKAVLSGRAEIRQGSVSQNPWPNNTFDMVTAFETVYFWPDFLNDLREVRRVLKPGGRFFICNEMNVPEKGPVPYEYWIKTLDLKTYTAAQFKDLLGQAGFADITIESEGHSRLCVSGKTKGEDL
jgi:SAM-dependent methyltransferase